MHPHTRQTGYLKYNFITTNKDCYRYSLYPRTIPEWNLLDLDTRIAPDVNSFKEKLDCLDIKALSAKAHFEI
ncbi:hypothetical protein HOLleu_04587 [Holothuria leucospilota]|uniref:Uncharacterized protein n=1 Tax=Holothuria leucospilota TaxID=206669 RepID=A0A9Q1HKW9_HOLLE|nr:hypothetical protein HOLleu_21961 [Holothuria leucospilota]KAJ8051134.1 hypothetical protein HOLleu_04587 [Holothuria leucospilota]